MSLFENLYNVSKKFNTARKINRFSKKKEPKIVDKTIHINPNYEIGNVDKIKLAVKSYIEDEYMNTDEKVVAICSLFSKEK